MEPRVCTECGHEYLTDATRCALDGAPLKERPDPLLRETLGGRYAIVRLLGRGGIGSVYLAFDLLVGRWVAAKIWPPEQSAGQIARERFLREARASSLLRHPRIAEVYDYGEHDGRLFLVMELLEGEALDDAIAREPLPFLEAVEVAVQVASALARAHQLKVVHRDIKPGNIFLKGEGAPDVRLLDFGIARMLTETRLTNTGELLGTPVYMSPEQASGLPCGPASDLYSLGVTLFEMVSQTTPFEGGSLTDLLYQHAKVAPPPLRARRPDAPEALEALVGKLLEKEPARRHRDAHHLLDDLRRLRDSLHAIRSHAVPWHARRRALERPALAHEDWNAHRARITGLVRSVFDAKPPPLVAELIDQFVRTLVAFDALQREHDRLGEKLAEWDRESALLREQLAAPIDASSREESRTSRFLVEAERALVLCEAEIERAKAEAVRCWGSASATLWAPERFTASAIPVLEAIGAAAAAWRERIRQRDEVLRERDRLAKAQQELVTELATACHRLDVFNGEAEGRSRRLQDDALHVRQELDILRRDLLRLIVEIDRQFEESPTLQRGA